MFFSREPSSAQKFFTVGRVFSMLWNIDRIRPDLREVVDDDPTIRITRNRFRGAESNYSGPYTGPESVRHFVVIAQGIRSSFCMYFYLILVKCGLLRLTAK